MLTYWPDFYLLGKLTEFFIQTILCYLSYLDNYVQIIFYIIFILMHQLHQLHYKFMKIGQCLYNITPIQHITENGNQWIGWLIVIWWFARKIDQIAVSYQARVSFCRAFLEQYTCVIGWNWQQPVTLSFILNRHIYEHLKKRNQLWGHWPLSSYSSKSL